MLVNESVGEVQFQEKILEDLFIVEVGEHRVFQVLKIGDERELWRQFLLFLRELQFLLDHVVERVFFKLGEFWG